MENTVLLKLLQDVENIARDAGKNILLPAFISQTSAQSIKKDGSIVTETDQHCQDFIQTALKNAAADIGFLGEEMSPEEQLSCLHQDKRFWCVDPIDGTGNSKYPSINFQNFY